MQQQEEETHSSFLFRNLFKGLLWFAVIITAFILMEDYIQSNFKNHIDEIRDNPGILYGVYTLSEIIFGILPPELFMMIWILDNIDLIQTKTQMVCCASTCPRNRTCQSIHRTSSNSKFKFKLGALLIQGRIEWLPGLVRFRREAVEHESDQVIPVIERQIV